MSIVDALLHAISFMLPAASVALMVTLAGNFFKKNRPVAGGLIAWSAINFIVCLSVLILGMILTGRDGKMLTYLAMGIASATVQFILSGLWRK